MGHWYSLDGSPCHHQKDKNGEQRDTTLRDARKYRLFPSVSTVKDLGEGYNLVKWKLDILMDIVVEYPQKMLETDEDYKYRTWREFNIRRTQASTRGTQIHDKLETYYSTGVIDKDDEAYLIPTIEFLDKQFPGVGWIAEKSFASKKYGFGGCVDLHSPDGLIIDFKTKDKLTLSKSMQYEDHRLQLAAYQMGLELPINTRRFNLFISTNQSKPGQVLLVECKDFEKHWKIFETMLYLWKLRNNYDPSTGGV